MCSEHKLKWAELELGVCLSLSLSPLLLSYTHALSLSHSHSLALEFPIFKVRPPNKIDAFAFYRLFFLPNSKGNQRGESFPPQKNVKVTSSQRLVHQISPNHCSNAKLQKRWSTHGSGANMATIIKNGSKTDNTIRDQISAYIIMAVTQQKFITTLSPITMFSS